MIQGEMCAVHAVREMDERKPSDTVKSFCAADQSTLWPGWPEMFTLLQVPISLDLGPFRKLSGLKSLPLDALCWGSPDLLKASPDNYTSANYFCWDCVSETVKLVQGWEVLKQILTGAFDVGSGLHSANEMLLWMEKKCFHRVQEGSWNPFLICAIPNLGSQMESQRAWTLNIFLFWGLFQVNL